MTVIKMEKQTTQTEKEIKALEAIERSSMEEVGKIDYKKLVTQLNAYYRTLPIVNAEDDVFLEHLKHVIDWFDEPMNDYKNRRRNEEEPF